MSLAPIGISTYSRLGHLKQTIESLQKNTLSKQTELYIFSDAPKKGDEEIVAKVRKYIHTVDGFKKVHIIERESNGRVFNNRDGMKRLLDKYDRMIFMEEDNVTAPGFLTFMNNALDFYKDDANVVSIAGYTPPINIPAGYAKDYISLQRFNGWGFGTWKDRYDKIEMTMEKKAYLKNIKDNIFFKKLIVNGEDIPHMIEQDIDGKINALDVKIMYQQIINDWYIICPRSSLVQNIGHDESGLHSGNSTKFEHSFLWDKKEDFRFSTDLTVDINIRKENYKIFSGRQRNQYVNILRNLGMHQYLKKIKETFFLK